MKVCRKTYFSSPHDGVFIMKMILALHTKRIHKSIGWKLTVSETHNTQRSEKLMKAAYKLLEQLQRCFCEDLCPKTRYQNEACPAKRLIEFMNWLRKEIDELCNTMEGKDVNGN